VRPVPRWHVAVGTPKGARQLGRDSCRISTTSRVAAGRQAVAPPGGGVWSRPAAPAAGSRAAEGRSEGPRSALDAVPSAAGSAAWPRQRPIRGRVQGPGRGAEGEAVPPPVSCPGEAGQRTASLSIGLPFLLGLLVTVGVVVLVGWVRCSLLPVCWWCCWFCSSLLLVGLACEPCVEWHRLRLGDDSGRTRASERLK
jgi:hypothetical protein